MDNYRIKNNRISPSHSDNDWTSSDDSKYSDSESSVPEWDSDVGEDGELIFIKFKASNEKTEDVNTPLLENCNTFKLRSNFKRSSTRRSTRGKIFKVLKSRKPKDTDKKSNQYANNALNTSKSMYKKENETVIVQEEFQKLKDSTKKLLNLVEDIQAKIYSSSSPESDYLKFEKASNYGALNDIHSVTYLIGSDALKNLEQQTKALDAIYIEDGSKECSIYKRLAGKCHCLNHKHYNDFIIHFTEVTKYYTSTIGEIIKNIRILKKFLYIGGTYTNNSLTFLIQGLNESSHTEKVEIIQGCSSADICNIFEDHSLVNIWISGPCKYEKVVDVSTQKLAASFLYKLSQLEEGRRYLKLNSKITYDIKKLLKKRYCKLEVEAEQLLCNVLNLLEPHNKENINFTYYCKLTAEEIADTGNKTLNGLVNFRQYMTLEEVCCSLDLLIHLCSHETGKLQLTSQLQLMLALFKNMMLQYDNSRINTLITQILNNIFYKTIMKDSHKTMVTADVATEPIVVKNATNQIPIKTIVKKNNKSNGRQASTRQLNKSRMFIKV